MSNSFEDYTLDRPPCCPSCFSYEVGIYESGYYCLECGFPFFGLKDYSNGVPRISLADALAQIENNKFNAKPCKICNMKDYTRKPPKIINTNHGSLAGILPDDYEECGDCNYDHAYDASPAGRWHQEHPECGSFLSSKDLIEEK